MTEMAYRRLGESGLMVSAIGLGGNSFGHRVDAETTAAVVHAALDAGVSFIDTADAYGRGKSEEFLGAALKGHRDDVVIATKFGADIAGANGPDWGARGARRYVVRAIEASLRRLGTDWIDLYQLHWPDPGTPLEETVSALDDLVHAGKVRYLGHSNHAAWQVADIAWTARSHGAAPFVSAQNHYNLLRREPEAELVPACQRFGVGLLPYLPLAGGLLTGKYRRGEPAPPGTRLAGDPYAASVLAGAPWGTIEALQRFAAERGLRLLDVAIGGLAAQPAVASVICGATTPEQLRANVAAGAWQPRSEDLAELAQLT